MKIQAVIGQSPVYKIFILGLSIGFILTCKAFLGNLTLSEAFREGGNMGKLAFALIVFYGLAVLGIVNLFVNLRKVIIDYNGIKISVFGEKNKFISWSDIHGVERSGSAVLLHMYPDATLIGEHMLASGKIIDAIQTFRPSASVSSAYRSTLR